MQVELSEPDLGVLELGCDPYVAVSLQIGSPTVREVMRDRSLADGAIDNTAHTGPRAVTLSLRLRTATGCAGGVDMQQLIDQIVPFMAPARRPTITWELPDSGQQRAMVVRGHQWPFTLAGPKHPSYVLQWVCPSGEIIAGGADAMHCETINPGTDTEDGRTYDEDFTDGGRGPYPDTPPVGARTIVNPGTAPAHWTLTIFGDVTNPVFTINGTALAFTNNGGLTIPAGQNITIDSRDHTVLMNGTPGDSRYDRVNYSDWTWNDMMLMPGVNKVRYDGDELGISSSAQLCFMPTFLG